MKMTNNPEEGDHVVLVVDDDKVMLRSVEAILRRGGYSPMVASGPFEALQRSRDFKGEIHLLLTDLQMPEMDGFALAQQILGERPSIRILLMSAATKLASQFPFLKKPFTMNELLQAVGSVVGGTRPLASDVFANEASDLSALMTEVDEAMRRYLLSSRKVLEITRETPSGIPYPDSVARIHQAANEQKRRFSDYLRARKKLEDNLSIKRQSNDTAKE